MIVIECVTSCALPLVAIDNRGDNRPPPVTQLSRWPSQPYLLSWVSLGRGWWWSVWSTRGLHTAPVICWRSVWRWGPASQHRISDRLVPHRLGLVPHRLGLVPSFSCSFWRPGTCHLLLSVVQVWGEGGCRRCEWCFFKPAVELIQIVCQLLSLHSAWGWCLVIGDVFQTFPHWSRVTGR